MTNMTNILVNVKKTHALMIGIKTVLFNFALTHKNKDVYCI